MYLLLCVSLNKKKTPKLNNSNFSQYVVVPVTPQCDAMCRVEIKFCEKRKSKHRSEADLSFLFVTSVFAANQP